MRRILMCLFVLGMTATTTHAQGINLAWRNCIAITTGANSAQSNLSYACDGSLPTPSKGVMSFFAPAALGHFFGIQAVIDIVFDQAMVPDYWRLGVGECREGSFVFPASLLGVGNTTTCRNPWAGANVSGGFQYTSGFGSLSRSRVLFAFARDTETTLNDGQEYIAGAFTIDTNKDVDAGDGECAGCSAQACLVLNQIELYQVPGQTPPQQDIYYLNYTALRNEAYWQGGLWPVCVTPTKRISWGRIKSTYR